MISLVLFVLRSIQTIIRTFSSNLKAICSASIIIKHFYQLDDIFYLAGNGEYACFLVY